jgi:hypothetical protein
MRRRYKSKAYEKWIKEAEMMLATQKKYRIE